jgi:hypothetical protein
MEHSKIGTGFAIRYAGYRHLQWSFGDDFRAQAPSLAIPFTHWAAIGLETVKTAGLLLQWWEMRKTHASVAAQLEERRLHWVVDMLTVLAREVQEDSTLRLDTLLYLEREVSRFLAQAQQSPLIDVPSSLLLQVDRMSEVLGRIAFALDNELPLGPASPMQRGERRFRYRSFQNLEEGPGEASLSEYLDAATKAITSRPLALAGLIALQPATVALAARVLLAARAHAQRAKRQREEHVEDFYALYRMAFEVRGLGALLSEAIAFPRLVRHYSLDDLSAGHPGQLIGSPTARLRETRST